MTKETTKRIDFPIVGQFDADLVRKVDAQRTINLYEVMDQEGKKPTYLSPWPGLAKVGGEAPNFATTDVRGSIVFKGFTYFVVGHSIYRMTPSEIIVQLSPPNFDTIEGYVGIAAVENQIGFTDGSKLLIWDNNAHTLTHVVPRVATAPNGTDGLPVGVIPQDITSIDGFFIITNAGVGGLLSVSTNQFYVSNLNDGTKWNDLAYAEVNSRPTTLTATEVLKRQVFLFGAVAGEIWYTDASFTDFPLRRNNNMLLEHGVVAQGSLVEGFDRLFYLSNDSDGIGSVMMVEGGTVPQPISTREIDDFIQTFSHPEKAVGYVLKINGQIFYVLNFTHHDDNHTFLYNVTGNRWYELAMLDGSHYVGITHIYFGNKHYIGTKATGNLYELKSAYLDNFGERIKRTRIARVLAVPTYERIRIDRFQVDMLQGTGIPTLPISDPDAQPVLFLSISEDGGITYADLGSQNVGASGERLSRTIWRRLGVRRDAIIKLEFFNKTQCYILGAAIDYAVLPE